MMRSTTVIDPGKLDRSPTGTGVSARLAVLVAQGRLGVGDQLVMRSIIDSTFVGTVSASTSVGDRPAIVPTVSGTPWITGTHEHTLDSGDPWPTEYRLSDTWPKPV
jgi:proline racemase